MAAGTALAAPDELNTKTLQLRHRTIVVEELEFGELVKTEKMANVTEKDDEGNPVTRYDERLQQKLMIDKSIKSCDPPLPDGGIDKLGARAVIALHTVVHELNYGDVDPTTGLRSALMTEMKNVQKDSGKPAKS